MGQDISSDAEDRDPQTSEDESLPSTETLSGYRVMKVFQGSPASRSNLLPFEDFIIAINGTVVDADNTSLANVLRENEGREVALLVHNCIDVADRHVALRPVKWNGPGLLGAAVRYEPLRTAVENVHRVVDVLPQSPADQAGLVPTTDFIVGTPAEVFKRQADFNNLVSHALQTNASASFMVYSTATSRTRNLEITPNPHWGGEGSLGCQLATGLLHRITRPTT